MMGAAGTAIGGVGGGGVDGLGFRMGAVAMPP